MDELVHTIAGLAAANHGMIETADMIAAGATRDWIARQVRLGWLTPIHRGIYLVGRSTPTIEGRWVANVRTGGDDAMLLGLSAAVHWEFLPRHRIPAVDDVFVSRRVRRRDGVRHRELSYLTKRDRRMLRGVLVGSPAAVIASLGDRLSTHELVHLLDRAEFRERTVARDLDRLLRRGEFHGKARVERALQHFANGESGLASGFEFHVDAALTRLGAPRALINPTLVLADGEELRVDRFWPAARLIGEADHGQHATRRQRGIDLGRDARSSLTKLDTARIPSWIPPDQRETLLRDVAERATQIVTGPPVRILSRAELRRRRA